MAAQVGDWRLGQYRQAHEPEFLGLYGPHGQNKVFKGQVLSVVLHHPRYISKRKQFLGRVIRDEVLVEGFDGPLRRHEIRLQVIQPKLESIAAEIWLTGPYIEEEQRPVGLWRLSHAVGLGPDELPPEYDLTHVSVFEHLDHLTDKAEDKAAAKARAAVYYREPEHPKRSLFSWMFGGEPSYHYRSPPPQPPPPPPQALPRAVYHPPPPTALPVPQPAVAQATNAPAQQKQPSKPVFAESFVKSYKEKREAHRLRAEASRAEALALDARNKAQIQHARKMRMAEAEAKGLLADYGHLINKEKKPMKGEASFPPSFPGAGKGFKLGGKQLTGTLSATEARKLGQQLDERPFDIRGKFCAFCRH